MRVATVFISFLAAGLLSGCGAGGPSVTPVTGKITVDGSPMAGIMVTLIGDGGPAMGLTGMTDDSGSFSITAAGGYEGAPTGKYKVILSPPQPEMDYSSGTAAKQIQFPDKYSSPKSEELTKLEVGSEPSVVNIDVATK